MRGQSHLKSLSNTPIGSVPAMQWQHHTTGSKDSQRSGIMVPNNRRPVAVPSGPCQSEQRLHEKKKVVVHGVLDGATKLTEEGLRLLRPFVRFVRCR
ncbi:hypothetical protein HPB49_016288 [Dermacentor silvarum]|uniref:Uncharacterized protein n=1 Tax=Dermacentor silvarum TaxID=543639 RepID=A0ACB8CS49_DERSI|nr:hypothetical protein HPB49_016288 [Dermacentor silvarum]